MINDFLIFAKSKWLSQNQTTEIKIAKSNGKIERGHYGVQAQRNLAKARFFVLCHKTKGGLCPHAGVGNIARSLSAQIECEKVFF